MTRTDTLIIGGGVSGLACARHLHDAGHDFRLVTDRLGGRMHIAPDGLNFGAAYVTKDYQHILQYAERAERIYLKNVLFWNGSRMVSVFSPYNTRHLGALRRVYKLIIDVRKRFNRYRAQAPFRCQKDLLESDPVLAAYAAMPATELVAEHGLEAVTEIYCGPLFYSTLFVPWEEANAFYYLANLFPIWLAVYTLDLTGAVGRLTAGFEDRITLDPVVGLESLEGGDRYRVNTAKGDYEADRLVLALPERNAQAFAGDLLTDASPAAPIRDVPFNTLHIRGQRRPEYPAGKTIFLRPDHQATVLWPQRGGADIAFSHHRKPDLSRYYESYEVQAACHWKTAVQLAFDHFRPLQPKENLFTIGDYNICGLEDSYLTGLYAANRITGKA